MRTPQSLPASVFYAASRNQVILDVRSPTEYLKGHIAGSISFPLFSDEERAEVGKLYKQNGKETAFLKGLEFVGIKMAEMVKQALKYTQNDKLYLYCWRGGMRSSSVARLLSYTGIDVYLLEGGYKAYRQYVLHYFDTHPYDLYVLGGKTGTGKTQILKKMNQMGGQIIDLEALANHRGSAFGGIMLPSQPSSEEFENLLFTKLYSLSKDLPIWVENESRTIGSIFIPQGFWDRMMTAPLCLLSISEEKRIQNLVAEYNQASPELLIQALEKIEKKLGGVSFQQAKNAFLSGDVHLATAIVLKYYDKSYLHSTAQRTPQKEWELAYEEERVETIAEQILLLSHSKEKSLSNE